MKKTLITLIIILSSCTSQVQKSWPEIIWTQDSWTQIIQTQNTCKQDLTKLQKTIIWNSMSPLLQNNNKINLLLDYYKICNKNIQKNDIVAYDYKWNKLALIKQIKVTDKDILSFSGSYLIVNKQILTNSIWEKYIFTKKQQNLISLYINEKHLQKDSFLIFGDNIYNSIDSKNFGAISQKDILGKFEIIK